VLRSFIVFGPEGCLRCDLSPKSELADDLAGLKVLEHEDAWFVDARLPNGDLGHSEAPAV
jgi:hypothetical protein